MLLHCLAYMLVPAVWRAGPFGHPELDLFELLLVWEPSWTQSSSRHIFLWAFMSCFTSSCFSSFLPSSTRIYDCLIGCLHFEISDILFFSRRGWSSNYHIISDEKSWHQALLHTIVRTSVAQGWLQLCRMLFFSAVQGKAGTTQHAKGGQSQDTAFTIHCTVGKTYPPPRNLKQGIPYSTLVLPKLPKPVKILCAHSSSIYRFMVFIKLI